ncbi:mitogen-activated protein kinase kinase kinase 14 [Gadus chalcogrammus]|uniref:mitogen-activated protein kinase kinase kinase 14 n=1 Tax=Gadus chalcogrammus TaxID=1042646 RepID=UPI0024C4BEDD|nr:mitogen-activated protein kinase kinase kinase 14 [Gadus chalcogrammus]
MAIPRLFNSYSPFLVVERGSGRTFLEKQDGPAGEEGEGPNEEEGSLLARAIRPQLSCALERGTAQDMTSEWPGALQKNPYVSIVAQAEGEGLQEFSPSSTEPMFPRALVLSEQRPVQVRKHAPLSESDGEACPPAHQRHPCRKPRRKPWRRRSLVENHQEPPIIQGLWVQEIDWLRPRPGHGTASLAADPTWTPSLPCGIIPPPPQFTDRVVAAAAAAAAHHRCHGDDAATSGDDGDRAAVRLKRLTLEEEEEEDAEHTGGQNHSGDPDSALGPRGGGGGGGSESARAPTASGGSASWASWSSDEPEAEFTSSSWSRGSDSSGGGSVPDCSDRSENPGGSGCTCASVAVGSQCTCAAEVGGAVGEGLLAELRGKVTRAESRFIWPFFKEREKQQPMHECTDADEQANEGILLHDLLQPAGWMYREGLEYDSLRHIQNGSYGDVVCIQDRRTGFQCAAKRVAQRHFSSEELSTWSALDSPHVVRLLGAVSEGPNVVLFMDLKPGCLAQVLKERVKLPEDLALHYLRQVLWALEHLHRRLILHLDIKADNVLLSADGRNTFLCDFGLSERCDQNGKSTRTYRGPAFPGTETHMAPEVAGGDQRCCKADVWSSCCMLLHMLNGCPPWVRYYAPPLCLKISSEPPPLWEVPSRCNHFTARLLRAGLRKDPGRRASARELRRKTTKALRAVGGLNPSSLPGSGPLPTEAPPPQAPMCWISPWRVAAIQQDSSEYEEAVSGLDSDEDQEEDRDPHPRSLRVLGWGSDCDPEVDIYMGEEEFWERRGVLTQRDRNYEGDWEEEEEEEEEEEWESSSSPGMFCALREHFPLLRSGVQRTRASWGSEPELTHLREDVAPDNPVVNLSPEPRDYPPSCLSCTDSSQMSDQDSDRWSDDLSSGVFSSYNSQNDGHMEWMLSANQPSSHCFEGVDIWIEDVHGACLRIRERRRVNVGHVAIGISDQISVKAFTLETLDRKLVSFQQEVQESGLWLRCVPAPDRCPRWYWRINDGKLDLRGAL